MGPACEEAEWRCAPAVERDGVWLRLTTFEASAADGPPNWLVPLVESVADRLPASPRPQAAEPAPEWWESDCDTVAAVTSVAERLGSQYESGFPEDGRTNPAFVILTTAGYQLHCVSYLLAGDATYDQDLLVQRVVDGPSSDVSVSLQTMDRISAFASSEPTVLLPAHEPLAENRLAERILLTDDGAR